MKTFTTALLITTYNWPEALDLVLKSLENQTVIPHEVIIGDDGSTAPTKALIDHYIDNDKLPITHVWQEDEGFQRTKILNKSIAQTDCDYIIQIDGDCILHPEFVADHIANARKSIFLFGSRVNILETGIQEIFKNKTIRFKNSSKWIKNKGRNIHLPFLGRFYKPTNELSKKLRGCNLSYWRDDFMAVNGYNEDMTGWGREDSEFALRLLHRGVLGVRMKYQGILYHIWHKVGSKSNLDINNNIQINTKTQKLISCQNGVAKYMLP